MSRLSGRNGRKAECRLSGGSPTARKVGLPLHQFVSGIRNPPRTPPVSGGGQEWTRAASLRRIGRNRRSSFEPGDEDLNYGHMEHCPGVDGGGKAAREALAEFKAIAKYL